MNDNRYLYERGFYITSKNVEVSFGNPSFWNRVPLARELCAFIHADNRIFVNKSNSGELFLIGHAYNPVRMQHDENSILTDLAATENNVEFFNLITELTGVFLIGKITDRDIMLIGDPACIQCVTYGIHEGFVHIASHTHMLEDVCNIKFDTYIKRLVDYRFYHLFGKTLPGDLSPYDEFKRLIPNHFVMINDHIEIRRFFPCEEYRIFTKPEAEEAEKKISKLLHNNLELITQKWKRPAISITGGCDSKTTLACANGLYDKFSYFSYVSSDDEDVDALAAQKICHSLGLNHKIYEIPCEDSAFENIEEVRETLSINDGKIGKSNANDVRKRAYFAELDDFDIEVKSWVSECGRAYYNKRFDKINFPSKPTPRYLTTLYKVFITDRRLVHQTDAIFREYLKKYLDTDEFHYPWQELFFWEFRVSSWNALTITGEHKYSFDITIPYNNRMIIDMLLRFPLIDRINDKAYTNIRERENADVDKIGIAVTNVKHTSKRAKLERVYLEIMSRIPF